MKIFWLPIKITTCRTYWHFLLYCILKILKLNNYSSLSEIIPKKLFQLALSSYSIGLLKNLWRNYSIRIGNKNNRNFTSIIFYKTNFNFPVITISCSRYKDREYIEIYNNTKKHKINNIIEMSYWFKNYFLDKPKI